MYGKGLGVLNATTGVSLLPNTGDNRVLLVVAASLIVSGVAVFAVSTVLARKNRQNAEAK